MRKAILFLVLTISISAGAQSTTVSATVTDTDSLVWSNAAYTFTFIPNPVDTVLNHYSWTGGTLAYQFSGTTNSAGTLSISIPDNGTITPAQSQWLVTICPNATAGCVNTKLTITGASQSITTALSAIAQGPRFPITTSGYGYGTVEVNNTPKPGSTFFNTTTGVNQTYNAGWAASGNSSGGPVNLCSLVTLPSGTTCVNGNIVIGTPAASVLISGIPAGYHNLVVNHALISSAGATTLQMVFNGSAATLYGWRLLSVNSGTYTTTSGAVGTATFCVASVTGSSAIAGGGTFTIDQYDSTTANKSVVGSSGENADPGAFLHYCGWNNTAAITSLTLSAASGNISGSLTIQGTN